MFFNLKKPYFLGIDFGASQIKAVELTLENGEAKLVNYGQVNMARLEKGQVTGENSYDDEVILYLRALLDRMKPKSTEVYVAMPAFMGLVSLIELPEMSEEELKEAVPFEAHKYIPSALEDVALSWEVLGVRQPEEGQSGVKMEVLLVAALNKEVARYKKYVDGVKLELKFLELETFSMVRSVVGDRPGMFLVIDIGSRTTNLVLVDEGLVKVSRNIDVGGKDITRTLSDALSITPERAEAMKKSAEDLLNVTESKLLFPILEMITNEALRVLESYRTKYPEKICQEVILSGGTAHMTGLATYFGNACSLPVSAADPWQRVKYASSAAADVAALGASFSVALGLALDGAESHMTNKKKSTFTSKKPFSLKTFLTKDL